MLIMKHHQVVKHKVFSFYTISDGYSEYEVLAVFLSKVYEKDDEVFKYYK